MRAQSGNQVKARFGRVPNAMATFANSPVALDGFLELSKSVNQGRLNTRQRELLALAIAQENECQYCLSSHTALRRGQVYPLHLYVPLVQHRATIPSMRLW
jgi:alkylhydroperoxidase family enzyme